MKHYTFGLMLLLLLSACAGKTPQGTDQDSTLLERPDSASIAEMAQVMTRDLEQMLDNDDIQSAAALCQEALDNISYFKSANDNTSIRIYTSRLRLFFSNHSGKLGDMASQNYIIKQLVIATNSPHITTGKHSVADSTPEETYQDTKTAEHESRSEVKAHHRERVAPRKTPHRQLASKENNKVKSPIPAKKVSAPQIIELSTMIRNANNNRMLQVAPPKIDFIPLNKQATQ